MTKKLKNSQKPQTKLTAAEKSAMRVRKKRGCLISNSPSWISCLAQLQAIESSIISIIMNMRFPLRKSLLCLALRQKDVKVPHSLFTLKLKSQGCLQIQQWTPALLATCYLMVGSQYFFTIQLLKHEPWMYLTLPVQLQGEISQLRSSSLAWRQMRHSSVVVQSMFYKGVSTSGMVGKQVFPSPISSPKVQVLLQTFFSILSQKQSNIQNPQFIKISQQSKKPSLYPSFHIIYTKSLLLILQRLRSFFDYELCYTNFVFVPLVEDLFVEFFALEDELDVVCQDVVFQGDFVLDVVGRQVDLEASVFQFPLGVVPDFVCEPCDSAHFLEDGLVAMIVKPVVVGEVAVDGV